MRLDLHIHTDASDGAWTPERVVEGAAQGRLEVIAIADHDTTASVARAAEAGASLQVQVIPALEVSSTHAGRDVHILGYFVDPAHTALRSHADAAVRRRRERMASMVDRLQRTGIRVTMADVEAAAGPGAHVLGRPHLARALVEAGYATSVTGAFQDLIGDHCDAFVPTQLLAPPEAVDLVRSAGGVAVWAHPPADLLDGLLPPLIDAGLGGLEVYRPTHARADVLRLEAACARTGLAASGGSDWHTPESGRALGDFFVEATEIQPLLDLGGI